MHVVGVMISSGLVLICTIALLPQTNNFWDVLAETLFCIGLVVASVALGCTILIRKLPKRNPRVAGPRRRLRRVCDCWWFPFPRVPVGEGRVSLGAHRTADHPARTIWLNEAQAPRRVVDEPELTECALTAGRNSKGEPAHKLRFIHNHYSTHTRFQSDIRTREKRMTEARRFPAPWYAEKISGGYVVRDANGQALAYVYARATMAEAYASQGAYTERSPKDCRQHRAVAKPTQERSNSTTLITICMQSIAHLERTSSLPFVAPNRRAQERERAAAPPRAAMNARRFTRSPRRRGRVAMAAR